MENLENNLFDRANETKKLLIRAESTFQLDLNTELTKLNYIITTPFNNQHTRNSTINFLESSNKRLSSILNEDEKQNNISDVKNEFNKKIVIYTVKKLFLLLEACQFD